MPEQGINNSGNKDQCEVCGSIRPKWPNAWIHCNTVMVRPSVDIGRFTLYRYNGNEHVYIECNHKSDAAGEGGGFNEAELEKVIADFYAKHF